MVGSAWAVSGRPAAVKARAATAPIASDFQDCIVMEILPCLLRPAQRPRGRAGDECRRSLTAEDERSANPCGLCAENYTGFEVWGSAGPLAGVGSGRIFVIRGPHWERQESGIPPGEAGC